MISAAGNAAQEAGPCLHEPARPKQAKRSVKAVRPVTVAETVRYLDGVPLDDPSADPMILLWREWREAFATANRLCGESQRLEARLARTIGYPRIDVPLKDAARPAASAAASATDVRDIDRLRHLRGAGGSDHGRSCGKILGLCGLGDLCARLSGPGSAGLPEKGRGRSDVRDGFE